MPQKYAIILFTIFVFLSGTEASQHNNLKYSCDTGQIRQWLYNSKRFANSFQLDSALRSANKVLNAGIQCKMPEFHIDALNTIGLIFFYQFNYEETRKNLNMAFELSREISYAKGMAESLYWQSYLYSALGNYSKSLAKMKEAITIFFDIGPKAKIGDCYAGLGYLYDKLGEPEKSVEEYAKSLNVYIEINDSALIADGYNSLGHSYYYIGDYKRAMEQYFTALAIWSTLKDSVNIAQAYGSLGSICLTQGNYEEALQYYSQQEQILLKNKNVFELAKAIQNLGVSYNYLNEYHLAISKYKRAIQLFYGMQFKLGLANVYNNLAQAYLSNHQPDSAKIFADTAIHYAIEINNQRLIAKNYLLLGQIKFEQEKYNSALIYFEEAILISKQIQDLETEKTGSKYLSEIYEKKGEYQKALTAKKRHYNLVDSLQSRQNLKQLTQLELQYEFDREKQQIELEKEKEKAILQANLKRERQFRNSAVIGSILLSIVIVLVINALRQKRKSNLNLNQKKQEIENKNKLLAEALNEKEALLKEIHHRVKNNLQIVSSLLNIQTEYSQDARILGAVHESQSRVKAMALIHQLLYQEESFTRINFENYLKQLTKTLEGIFKKNDCKVITEIHAEKVALDIDTSIPLGLIVTELVSNAYKYAFNDSKQGHIKVSLSEKTEHQFELVVTDDGPGMPDNFNLEKTNSMGLKLVKLLSDQIDGELSFQNKKGATFNLTFKETE